MLLFIALTCIHSCLHFSILAEGARNLREKMRQELVKLVKNQRINQLCKGAWFNTVSRGKIKESSKIFFQLSANKKALHWSPPGKLEYSPSSQPKIGTDLTEQCQVSDIKELKVGRDLPSMMESSGRSRKVGVCFGGKKMEGKGAFLK